MRVHGAGLNRADLVQRAGLLPRAARVAAPTSPASSSRARSSRTAPASPSPRVGARVFGIAGGGGQAELLAVPAAQCAPRARRARPRRRRRRPRGVHHRARRDGHAGRGRRPGETVLVHAVGSGVGTAAVQLGQASGCTVVGTARTAEKLEQCRAARARPRGARRRASSTRPRSPPTSPPRRDRSTSPSNSWVATTSSPTSRSPGLRGRIVLVGLMAGTARAARPRRAHVQAAPHATAPCSAGARSRRRPRRPTRSPRDVVPLLASGAVAPGDRAHVAARRRRARPTTSSPPTRCSATSCSTSPEPAPCRPISRSQHAMMPGSGRRARSTRNGRTRSRPITQCTVSCAASVGARARSRRWWWSPYSSDEVAGVRRAACSGRWVDARAPGAIVTTRNASPGTSIVRRVAVDERVRRRVLVADDVPRRRAVAQRLEREGHLVEAARGTRGRVGEERRRGRPARRAARVVDPWNGGHGRRRGAVGDRRGGRRDASLVVLDAASIGRRRPSTRRARARRTASSHDDGSARAGRLRHARPRPRRQDGHVA